MGGGQVYSPPARCAWCREPAVTLATDIAGIRVALCADCQAENANPKSKTRIAMAKSAERFRARVAARSAGTKEAPAAVAADA